MVIKRIIEFSQWFRIALMLVLIVALGAMVVACDDDGEDKQNKKPGIVVTLLPQAEFTEKIGGDKVEVTVMVPPGANVHTYEPTPSQMIALAKAELYAKVGSGIEFELAWMDKLVDQNKDMLVVDCSKEITLIEMSAPHEHEDEGDHNQEGMDPHIWMSPRNAMMMVENICDGLVQVDPTNKSYYESNRDAYLEELSQLDRDIKDGLASITNRVFMVYHPAFGYFAHEYELKMLPIEEEGKEPTAKGLTLLINEAKEHNIKVIFAEPQFDPKSADVIADEINGTVILIDPLSKDYTVNMRSILSEMVKAME
ncbi:MAG: zinc ABC transporter substrate-binding protein [Chloroflexi bacterium]|nr:zinc ABC transporter substrate-binding protein [Chloroflexota bacterium]